MTGQELLLRLARAVRLGIAVFLVEAFVVLGCLFLAMFPSKGAKGLLDLRAIELGEAELKKGASTLRIEAWAPTRSRHRHIAHGGWIACS
jgi:hypothetical protein